MAELFIFGSLWFWVLVVVEFSLLMGLVETEHGGIGLFTLAVFSGLLWLGGGPNVLQLVVDYPWYTVVAVLGYFVAGAFWMVFRWAMFAQDKFDELKDDWQRWNSTKTEEEWTKHVQQRAPLVSEHRGRLMRWCGYWWLSMISYLFSGILTRICRRIYHRFSTVMQQISDKIFLGGRPR